MLNWGRQGYLLIQTPVKQHWDQNQKIVIPSIFTPWITCSSLNSLIHKEQMIWMYTHCYLPTANPLPSTHKSKYSIFTPANAKQQCPLYFYPHQTPVSNSIPHVKYLYAGRLICAEIFPGCAWKSEWEMGVAGYSRGKQDKCRRVFDDQTEYLSAWKLVPLIPLCFFCHHLKSVSIGSWRLCQFSLSRSFAILNITIKWPFWGQLSQILQSVQLKSCQPWYHSHTGGVGEKGGGEETAVLRG